jgi:hypothetical protein
MSSAYPIEINSSDSDLDTHTETELDYIPSTPIDQPTVARNLPARRSRSRSPERARSRSPVLNPRCVSFAPLPPPRATIRDAHPELMREFDLAHPELMVDLGDGDGDLGEDPPPSARFWDRFNPPRSLAARWRSGELAARFANVDAMPPPYLARLVRGARFAGSYVPPTNEEFLRTASDADVEDGDEGEDDEGDAVSVSSFDDIGADANYDFGDLLDTDVSLVPESGDEGDEGDEGDDTDLTQL